MPDDELDRLYGLPLDEFTSARNELAKQLRREGDKEGADRVRGLAKPSVAAWTANQLARRRGDRVKKLLSAADELRAAHEHALGGSESAEKLRSAAQRERELVASLRRDARELLAEAGRSPTDATLERVATTLSSAARDAEARSLLEAGRLTEEVATTGFEAFAGMALPDAPARARPRREAAKAPAPTRKGPSREDEAEQRRREAAAKKRAAELRKQADALEKKAERTERAAERAAEEAERAAEEARSARAAADEARAEADEAES